jgi:hypothetical protein
LYINAWADGVGTPVLTDSTDDTDADSKQVQLMNLVLPAISSSELAAVPSFDGAALSSFSAVASLDAAEPVSAASAVSGAWWCMVVYGGVWWCVPLLIVTQGTMVPLL